MLTISLSSVFYYTQRGAHVTSLQNTIMSWSFIEKTEDRVRQLALFSAIIHLFLGMSCIIIILMYFSIFWIYYLLASAPNYAVSVILLHGIKHQNLRSVKLWIVYNVLQVIFCSILFCFTCYQYFSVESSSKGNTFRTNDTKYLDTVMAQKMKMGALVDAATALTFIILISTCCNMVIHYHDEMKMREVYYRKHAAQEQKEAVLWILIQTLWNKHCKEWENILYTFWIMVDITAR